MPDPTDLDYLGRDINDEPQPARCPECGEDVTDSEPRLCPDCDDNEESEQAVPAWLARYHQHGLPVATWWRR